MYLEYQNCLVGEMLTTCGGDKSSMAGSQAGSSEIKGRRTIAQPCQETPWSLNRAVPFPKQASRTRAVGAASISAWRVFEIAAESLVTKQRVMGVSSRTNDSMVGLRLAAGSSRVGTSWYWAVPEESRTSGLWCLLKTALIRFKVTVSD